MISNTQLASLKSTLAAVFGTLVAFGVPHMGQNTQIAVVSACGAIVALFVHKTATPVTGNTTVVTKLKEAADILAGRTPSN